MSDSQDKPRKILLGKKVIRHFAVRTGIQTGAKADTSMDASTDDSSGQLDPSKETNNTCSGNTSTGTGCTGGSRTPPPASGGVATANRCGG